MSQEARVEHSASGAGHVHEEQQAGVVQRRQVLRTAQLGARMGYWIHVGCERMNVDKPFTPADGSLRKLTECLRYLPVALLRMSITFYGCCTLRAFKTDLRWKQGMNRTCSSDMHFRVKVTIPN